MTPSEQAWAAYLEAGARFARMAALVGDRWAAPALGQWDVRGLVGHVVQGMGLWEQARSRPAAAVALDSVSEYVEAAAGMDQELIARAGHRVGAELGANPLPRVQQVVARQALLPPGAKDDLVITVLGGMRAEAYLVTRIVEVTIHTADLAAALGQAPDLPESASRITLHALTEIALDTGTATPLIRAASGRGPLPPGYSLLSADGRSLQHE